jgi:hypothetical protein
MMAAFRTDVLVAFQVSAVEHRLAGRALGPQTLRNRLARRPHERLIFGGSSFCNQLMVVTSTVSIAERMPATKLPDSRRRFAGGSAFSISSMMRLPITTASATAAMRAGGGAVTDAEADADRHADLLADQRYARATSSRSSLPEPVTPFSET